jgi:hypothetical protein
MDLAVNKINHNGASYSTINAIGKLQQYKVGAFKDKEFSKSWE